MSLGDLFPAHVKEQLLESKLQPGSVIKMFVTDTTPPKTKYFILLSADGDKLMIATVFINSDINPHNLSSPELASLQYKLCESDYNFLWKDSYANCASISERKIDNLKKDIDNDPNIFQGNINEKDFKAMRELIKKSKVIKRKIIKKYRLYF